MGVLAVNGYTWWETFNIFLMAGVVAVLALPVVMLFAWIDRWRQERREEHPRLPAKAETLDEMWEKARERGLDSPVDPQKRSR